MSQEHVWACGQCGARVMATVGAIARTFKAHLVTCPALARRRTSAAALGFPAPCAPAAAARRTRSNQSS